MLLRGFAFLILLPMQDPDLIDQLGDSDVRVRERATNALAAKGSAVREELIQARRHRDPEIRSRALDLLCRFDRAILLEKLMTGQRGRKLGLFAATQTDLPANVAVTDGARFTFNRRAWAPGGEVLGTIVETSAEAVLEGDLRWNVAAIRSDRELTVERCGIHSPHLVYVPGVPPAEVQVVLRGSRTWRCDVPVVFRDPAEGKVERFGPFTLTIEWPQLVLRSDGVVLQSMLDGSVRPAEIDGVLKPDRQPNGFEGGMRFGRSVCGGIRRKPVSPAWCGCEGNPFKDSEAPEPQGQSVRVPILLGQIYKVDDFESLSFPFHMPVHEQFEVTSPALK